MARISDSRYYVEPNKGDPLNRSFLDAQRTAEALAAQPKSIWTVAFQDGQFEAFEAHNVRSEDGFSTFTNWTPHQSVEEFVARVNNVAIKYIRKQS